MDLFGQPVLDRKRGNIVWKTLTDKLYHCWKPMHLNV
jgi:hypothetical protein